MTPPTGNTVQKIALALILPVAVLVLYRQACGFDWLAVDDRAYTIGNEAISGGLTLAGVKTVFTKVIEA